MEKHSGTKELGQSHYDYNFDFDIDLRLKPHEYLLIIPYVLFIIPFIWAVELFTTVADKFADRRSPTIDQAGFQSEHYTSIPVGPSCHWPKQSHI